MRSVVDRKVLMQRIPVFENVITEFLEGIRLGPKVGRRFESPVLWEAESFIVYCMKEVSIFSTVTG